MRRIGFTGARTIPTPAQANALRLWAADQGEVELHHGLCIGSDRAMHLLAKLYGWWVVGHPALVSLAMQADIRDCDELREPKKPLVRNVDIVLETEELVATPDGPERLRSGTWSTIRRARDAKRKITIIWPDGRITTEGASPTPTASSKSSAQTV